MKTQHVASTERDKEELLFECERRQKEIYQNDQLTVQIAAYIVAFTGAVIGFAIPSAEINNGMKSVLAFLVAVVAYLGLGQHNGRTQGTYINAAYIRVFIESKLREVKWENRLSRFRELAPKSGVIDTVSHLGLIYMVIIAMSTFLSLYFLWHVSLWQAPVWPTTESRSIIARATIVFMSVSVVGFFAYREWSRYALLDEDHMRDYEQAWNSIRQQE